mmetsp:Transcript_14200/g.29013  ORF Transcript_14200/g.29013 Transcript_14200/m.29013 type:complete len:92 (-) Transcript_14200:291-566(-)
MDHRWCSLFHPSARHEIRLLHHYHLLVEHEAIRANLHAIPNKQLKPDVEKVTLAKRYLNTHDARNCVEKFLPSCSMGIVARASPDPETLKP